MWFWDVYTLYILFFLYFVYFIDFMFYIFHILYIFCKHHWHTIETPPHHLRNGYVSKYFQIFYVKLIFWNCFQVSRKGLCHLPSVALQGFYSVTKGDETSLALSGSPSRPPLVPPASKCSESSPRFTISQSSLRFPLKFEVYMNT